MSETTASTEVVEATFEDIFESKTAAKKKPDKPAPEPITREDRAELDALVEKEADPEQRDRVRSALHPQGLRRILKTYVGQYQAVEDALLIVDRWDPRNQRREKEFDPKNPKRPIGLPRGDFDNVDELEGDGISLQTLNTRISFLWATASVTVSRARSRLETLKAEAKTAASSFRSGRGRGKITNQEQVEALARTTKAVKEAERDLLDAEEQEAILKSFYYSIKDLSDSLMRRGAGLRGEIRRQARMPG